MSLDTDFLGYEKSTTYPIAADLIDFGWYTFATLTPLHYTLNYVRDNPSLLESDGAKVVVIGCFAVAAIALHQAGRILPYRIADRLRKYAE